MQADLYNGRKMVVDVVAQLSSTKDAFTTTVYTLRFPSWPGNRHLTCTRHV